MSQQNKHLLFFSNFCQYCKDLMSMIVKKNIKQMFLFINVDEAGRKYPLPPIVDRVPMIITSSKQVVADENIMAFINSIAPRDDDITPFSLAGNGSTAYSDMFSFIDERECNDDFCRGFVRLNERESTIDPNSAEMFSSREQNQSASAAAYDRFLSERDSDMKTFMGR